MSSIKNVSNIPSEINKLNKNKSVKESKQNADGKKTGNVGKDVSRDQAQISSAGRELLALRQEAEKYLNDIKQAETLSAEEVDQIKDRLESKYYLKPEVIDSIVDKLTQLPEMVKGTPRENK